MDNEEYAAEYVESRGLTESYHRKIRLVFNHYSKYQGATLQELIDEADMEEEQGIRWKRRKIKKRLINYMNYCKKNMLLSSAKGYFGIIKSFYTHNEIELGQLPRWNNKNANIPDPITSKDMLTKPLIREALKIANHTMRPIILLEASAGMTRSDVLGLTVSDFLKATYEYHHMTNIQDAVNHMLNTDKEVIGTFHLRRQKNNKYFITFSSPEANIEICKYLKLRDQRNHKYHRPLLTDIDRLFKISGTVYIDKFTELNNALNRGRRGTYGQIRGHMLRKFHATQLEKFGMSRSQVNVLQGKSNNAVDDVYFIEDESTLRSEYLKAMKGILIYTDVKKVTEYSPEYQQLKEENEKYQNQINNIWTEISLLKNKREKRLGD